MEGIELIIYLATALICVGVVMYYVRSHKRKSQVVAKKVEVAKATGKFEPVSLHPFIDTNLCIGSGACIRACPEEDILGIIDGVATVINASSCIGHGACFHACPVDAIDLRIGTEKRGVDLPHVKPTYETNVDGIYIAGELGGMGLIRNSVEQGVQAVENLAKTVVEHSLPYDVAIIGAGPAGLGGSLAAKRAGLKFITLDQDSLGGTVYTFPRTKVVMTQPMDLPLYGKVKLTNTSKDELLELWTEVLEKNDISIRENTKVDSIKEIESGFELQLAGSDTVQAHRVLIAIGRRGTPRKLGVPGEDSQKVAYRLLEPEEISGEKIMVVGGGDSAVESALLLCDQNEVTLSYRKENFSRIKPGNSKNLDAAMASGKLQVELSSNVTAIEKEAIKLQKGSGEVVDIPNDRIYIFIGGELPIPFLENCGIDVNKHFGKVMKKHGK
ncbi:MAG: NAD(P)-binding domain-containing protein [Flavobacteriia bacterium]|nr:NAD(P)-binding domain-containing protein [Flavobacteriia bacterium]